MTDHPSGVLIACSPTAVLLARKKISCPVCTTDDSLPVMIEEGSEWAAHIKTKVHKRLAAGKSRGKQRVRVSTAASQMGREDKTGTGDLFDNADDATPTSLDGLFGT
jgi:hypothetical protein